MKRRAFAPAGLPGLLLLSAFSLVGCPIYDHEQEGCFSREDCAPGYSCDRDTGECVAPDSGGCRRPSDCGTNETCDMNGDCRLGDCSFADIGCVDGYECSRDSGAWRCEPEGSSSSGGSGGSSSGGSSSGGSSQGGEPPNMGGFGGDGGVGGDGGFSGEGPVGGQPNSGGAGGEAAQAGNGPMSGAGGA